MKIKIVKILKDAGENVWKGKTSWSKLCELAHTPGQFYVKTFSENYHKKIQEGLEIEAEEKISSKGYVWYNVYAKDFGGGEKKKGYNSSPEYTLKEYDKLFAHAVSIVEKKFETIEIPDMDKKYDLIVRLASTYMISAMKAGVKMPSQSENNLNNAGSQDTPIDNIDSDDDIPF